MFTPSSSRPRAPGPPWASYLAALPLVALLFIGLSMLDQRETFAPLFGLEAAAPAPAQASAAEVERGAAAERTVRAYAAAVAESQRTGAPGALMAFASPALVAELGAELVFSRAQHEPPLELVRLELLSVEPAGAPGAFTVLTDESWAAPEAAARPSRLRFRYTVAPAGGELRVEEAVPVLPVPRP